MTPYRISRTLGGKHHARSSPRSREIIVEDDASLRSEIHAMKRCTSTPTSRACDELTVMCLIALIRISEIPP